MKKFHTKDFLGKFSIFSLSLLVLPCLFSSCQNEEDLSISKSRSTILKLNVAMPLESVTVSMGYESGSKEENTISDYRIYIYDTDNKYIMSLNNPTIDVSDTELNTVYTITAEITDEEGNNQLEKYSNFKVVMLANWEEYVTPQESSTLEELCESEYAQYSAFTNSSDFDLASSGKHIPYYGVHEYSNITFPNDGTLSLESLTLLRAMAKVEIFLENDLDDGVTFDEVTIIGYNQSGYCAPSGVYSQDDYGQPTNWETDYVTDLHLVNNGENDDGATSNTMSFWKEQEASSTQQEKWIAYLPEYNNMDEDFSYINVTIDGTIHTIYFADYQNQGTTTAYEPDGDTSSRWNVRRNNLYRYYVTVTIEEELGVRVRVNNWEYLFDNAYIFGEIE